MKPQESSPPIQSLWDVNGTLERLGGDEKLLDQVVKIFVDQAPRHLRELRLALAQGDTETVERTAHRLKGELGYLGVSGMSQKAGELEEMGEKHDLKKAAGAFPVFEQEITALLESMRGAGDRIARAASSGEQR